MVLRGMPPRDTLTGLSTRAVAIGWAAGHSRDRGGGVAAAFVVDLDGFREVNSELGLEVGDGVLVEVGDRLAGVIGDRGIVARLDGDEFVVLIGDLREPVPATVAAVRSAVQAAIRRPIVVEDGPDRTRSIELTASIGVATTGEGSDLLGRAGRALSEAKRARRGHAGRGARRTVAR